MNALAGNQAEWASQFDYLGLRLDHLCLVLAELSPQDNGAMMVSVLSHKSKAATRPEALRFVEMMPILSECARTAATCVERWPERLIAVAEAAEDIQEALAGVSVEARRLFLEIVDPDGCDSGLMGYLEAVARAIETAAARIRPRAH